MTYKIIFFDVDGTLIDYQTGEVSATTQRAIRQLKKDNYVVVAATGRPLSMCLDLELLGIDAFITANGAYVKYKDEVIYKSVLSKETVTGIRQFAERSGHSLTYFTETLTMNGIRNENTLAALRETLSLDAYPEQDDQAIHKEIYLMCLYGNQDTIQLYEKEFPGLRFQQWHPQIANVLQNEVSKSIAAQHVLEYFHLQPSEAIAFGDGENDIDLFQLVGFGVAMGNGHENLKRIADFVTKDCADEGIEYALKTLKLI
ncbi:Cof-type HAD-IIB family hydrolase [Sporosarcina cyprini]|uniref:Cof-type HAD-IIB family hydrolase n=1 Tax=Sporosarcina cyprini TaxID=2910523 RepID=UPI001EDE7262|nr:Cof-type HAD-IIB family hydrolase [Sporosarcina cyprini]MCG3089681.1 Cof-type HAD-IIB family hydrolase [Sporosarcina cyprini]